MLDLLSAISGTGVFVIGTFMAGYHTFASRDEAATRHWFIISLIGILLLRTSGMP